MAIVLIGGTGFIGRHLSERLSARRIAAVTSSFTQEGAFLRQRAPGVKFIEANSIEMRSTLAEATTVVYLAHRARPASHISKPFVEIESGLAEFARFMSELCELNPECHVIFPSSGGQVYGSGFSQPVSETNLCAPETPYGLGKHYAEQYLEFLARTRGLKSTILRLANPVGKWQLRGAHGFVSAAVRAAVLEEKLTVFGRGDNWRDYFDAEDLAEFLADLCLQEKPITGTFNIGSGIGQTENHVIRMIESILNKKLDVEHLPARSFDMPYAVLSIEKAQQELGWKPSTELSESILLIRRGMTDPLIND
ncbi:MAG: NAD-dependent epimerase/dehydratase family protein [bacterium]